MAPLTQDVGKSPVQPEDPFKGGIDLTAIDALFDGKPAIVVRQVSPGTFIVVGTLPVRGVPEHPLYFSRTWGGWAGGIIQKAMGTVWGNVAWLAVGLALGFNPSVRAAVNGLVAFIMASF
jgi:hypothetical protein